MNAKQAHLEMIQGVINRISQNSFLLKSWGVVLISSTFALAVVNTQPLFIYLAYFPLIAFWGLDGYFLRQERLFRKLYDRVRNLLEDQIDFSMDTAVVTSQVDSFWYVTLSKTLLAFHGMLLVTVLIIMAVVLSIASPGGACNGS